MTQLDLIPAKPFSQIEHDNLMRYARAPYGSRTKVLKANRETVTACLTAEVYGEKIPVKSYRRVKSRHVDQALQL